MTRARRAKVTSKELDAFEVATQDLVGVALRSVEGLEVSLPQFRLLRVLDEFGPTGATQCALLLDVAGSSVTRLADRLAASGHLERGADPTNRSAVVLSLTDAGEALVSRVRERRRRDLGDALATLDADVRAACVTALVQLHEGLAVAHNPRVPY